MGRDADFDTALATVLAKAINDFESLISYKPLTAGASQETYRITAQTEAGERQLAMRRSQTTLDGDSSVGFISLETEARLFQVAKLAGVPGPSILYVLQQGDGLGNGFLMEWLEGETLGHRIVRSDELAAVRPTLAAQCGEILARIHAIDWQANALDACLPTLSPGELVEETFKAYCEFNVPVPMIDYSWRWLQDHLPQHSRTTLVHGDFRNGNLMITPQGINAVLDWELAQIGDPVRDLGWLCVNSWRFGCDELPVGGFGEMEDLLTAYSTASGVDVTAEELRFWQVYGSFWWSMGTLRMANAWRSGEVPSLERPVIGRRSSEAQMDCVNLLIPGPVDVPDSELPLTTGTVLPSQAELMEGVARFLKDEVAGQLASHNGYLAKVAANSLRIAQREALIGPTLRAQELARLNDLLGTKATLDEQRWELVKQLRNNLPLDTPGLTDHLRQTVAGQLAIDQPRYPALHTALKQS
ncbi:MAG: phosphotransferase family protein [Pseudomonadota bacterium]